MELIDIGANLTHESFHHDLEPVLARAAGAGVSQFVITGSSERDSRAACALAGRYPGVLYSTAGVHPHEAEHWTEKTADVLATLFESQHVVAAGETGLDFNRDFSPRPLQERAFEAQLELAAASSLPVFLHERDAHDRFFAILGRHRHRLGAVVIHCFTGTSEELDAYLDLDLHVGMTGWLCDERRGLHLRGLVPRIPSDRLMLETDAPYLLPRDLRPRPKSRRNEPSHLRHIADTVARCAGVPLEELAATTTATARAFFGLANEPVQGSPNVPTTRDTDAIS